ncbi:hypothetical protein SLA2020_405220 [Shorea laevis]
MGWRLSTCYSGNRFSAGKLRQQGKHLDAPSPLAQQCKALIARKWDCPVHHVYREGKTCADIMASLSCYLEKWSELIFMPRDDPEKNKLCS